MGKDKLRKFRENLTFDCFVQPEFDEVFRRDHPLKGHWHDSFFRNDNPIVLELGCGKGEYTVALAERAPSRNYIGIDIKGARMWRGAKTATERGMRNVGFLRTRIEFINGLFGEGEVSEIWITFPDPQLKTRRAKKRLTSPLFLEYPPAPGRRDDPPQNRLQAPLRLHERGHPPLRSALRGLEPRHLRLGVCRRGAFGENGLRTVVPRHGAADHLHALLARRPARIPLVRLGGGRKAGEGQRSRTRKPLTRNKNAVSDLRPAAMQPDSPSGAEPVRLADLARHDREDRRRIRNALTARPPNGESAPPWNGRRRFAFRQTCPPLRTTPDRAAP